MSASTHSYLHRLPVSIKYVMSSSVSVICSVCFAGVSSISMTILRVETFSGHTEI